jgi:formylglycine-generating enzyme required for sulfatase activity
MANEKKSVKTILHLLLSASGLSKFKRPNSEVDMVTESPLSVSYDAVLSKVPAEIASMLITQYDSNDKAENFDHFVESSKCPEPTDRPGAIINSIGMKLLPIAAGNFVMGVPESEKSLFIPCEDYYPDKYWEIDQHEVKISRAFFLGITQVTQSQYLQVIGKNPSFYKNRDGIEKVSSDFPVENVSWKDAIVFCEKLSSLPEERKAGRVYRLPTEAEWEFACRAGSSTAYYFGDDPNLLDRYGWNEYRWYDFNNKLKSPQRVARKEPNAFGLYDMHGNVWEWCSDCCDWFDDQEPISVEDPIGTKGEYRVSRGGSWCDVAADCRSGIRRRDLPAIGYSDIGFRVAMFYPK